jgi:histone deacetylase complex regulatory component SIN3
LFGAACSRYRPSFLFVGATWLLFDFSNHRRTANNKSLMEDVDVENRLECKICLSTYRLFYVEDTEDYFYRRGQLSAARQQTNNKQRVERFQALCDSWAKRKSRSHAR